MAKLDPRADPLSKPPQSKDDFSVDRVAVPKNAMSPSIARGGVPVAAPLISGTAEPVVLTSSVVPVAEDSATDGAEEDDAETTPLAPPGKITSQDPRYEPIEKLLDVNDWKKIGAELGPMAEIGKLPPNLGLVAALAHNENAKDGDPEAMAAAIRCMAGLLGVVESSPLAGVLARRMLRKNPVRIRDRQAPPARTSLLIVLATLVIGGGVGWLASIGSWRGILQALHLH